MIELHTSRHLGGLSKGRVQYYCTRCRKHTRIKRVETPVALGKDDMELDLRRVETRCVAGHESIQVYVSNERTRNRFGKVGSY
jgi:ribosomal protein L44E